MKRKRIGLLVGHVEESFQRSFIEGFLKEVFGYDYDVCVFAMYNKYQETTAREIGESTIFSLINYELLDAIVVLLDTIQTPGVVELLEKKLREQFKGPVLCVDKKSDYFPSLMTEHYSAVKKIVSHLIEVHGYTDIAYLTGKKWHDHSQERLRAFTDCMTEHGLTLKENRIFYGDYWYSSGETMVEKLIQTNAEMPRAIACANDCMAIGVAKALEVNGYRIPEDVAVVGYDSIEAGRTSPKPLTSAPIPALECGNHAAIGIKAMMEGKPLPGFNTEVELFIGQSCGCNGGASAEKSSLRESWETADSEESFFSRFNYMVEDMLSKYEFNDLMNTIFNYVYQITGFKTFNLCLNSQWKDLTKLDDRDIQWSGYTDRILPVLHCDRDDNSSPLNYEQTFSKSMLLPELDEERDKPGVFYFTPLHFEERCLGYAVISYDEAKIYDEIYWLWLRNVMQGLECFRRIYALQQTNQLLQSTHIRDSLTGLYNYQGMLKQAESFIGAYCGSIAIDIKRLSDINEKYGREQGNRAIRAVAHEFNHAFDEGVCCRLGNGEFVGVIITEDDNKKKINEIKEELFRRIDDIGDSTTELSVYAGYETQLIDNREDFERLINAAVAQKNGNKLLERKMANNVALTKEEQEEAEVVCKILDENRFRYHFQPIVSAETGEIYAYEALMRADVTPYMSPVKILKYAEHLKRLYDVERSTFFNILDCIENNEAICDGRKVFINSIPGIRLDKEDAVFLLQRMKKHSGSVVVELTEQAQIDDEALVDLKKDYGGMGVETAVDDYGTGYSNITNLLRYMPNYIKIDRMLLTKIHESPQKQHFVREIVEFAHNNNIKALAEGVETTEELQMVIHLGVDLIQGYYTAKPSAEILFQINEDVRDEIVHYHNQELANKGRHVYVAGKESRILLAKLVADRYASIEIVSDKAIYRDVTITGVPGVDTGLSLDIQDGYQGRIVLENVSFSGKKKKACINIGKNCEINLVLKGESSLREGGICVPESSKLIIEGDGDLAINTGEMNYFGIGNDLESAHGTIIFEQDGCIEIGGSGYKGIGIGSGLGGVTEIRRGKYIIGLTGEEALALGSFDGDSALTVSACSISVSMTAMKNIGIGSVNGNLDLHISHTYFRGYFGGNESIAIGTPTGKRSHIEIDNSSINMNMRSESLSGLGQAAESSELYVKESGVYFHGDGKNAICFGNFSRNGKINMINSDVSVDITNEHDFCVGAMDEDIDIRNGRYLFNYNGREISMAAET